MYCEKFLISARHAEFNDCSFIKGRVRAEYRVDTVYTVDVKIDKIGVIQETQCECGAGSAPTAHCKHVGVVLHAMTTVSKGLLTAETCTQLLQTFNKAKKFKGSPVQLQNLNLRKNSLLSNLAVLDPRRPEHRCLPDYDSVFRNAVVNSPACRGPIRHNFPPANLFA
jgi:hypothetical protein